MLGEGKDGEWLLGGAVEQQQLNPRRAVGINGEIDTARNRRRAMRFIEAGADIEARDMVERYQVDGAGQPDNLRVFLGRNGGGSAALGRVNVLFLHFGCPPLSISSGLPGRASYISIHLFPALVTVFWKIMQKRGIAFLLSSSQKYGSITGADGAKEKGGKKIYK